jgi:hypothetical protein
MSVRCVAHRLPRHKLEGAFGIFPARPPTKMLAGRNG